jgi:transcriptional regulator with XRE-family HTH domain
MSNKKSGFSIDVGARLREERMRLGLTQGEFAALGGLEQRAQLNYESGVRSPDANYLGALKPIGVDVVYVLTGQRSTEVLADEESELIGSYRQLNGPGRAAVRSLVQTCLESSGLNSTGEPASPQKSRVKRLASNRFAEIDQQAAETVRKAVEAVGTIRSKRPAKKTTKVQQNDSE